jgi:hypothetical protein
MEVEWSASRPDHFTHGEIAFVTHWRGGNVGPKAGLDSVPRNELNPGRPAPSPSLYQLSHPYSREYVWDEMSVFEGSLGHHKPGRRNIADSLMHAHLQEQGADSCVAGCLLLHESYSKNLCIA